VAACGRESAGPTEAPAPPASSRGDLEVITTRSGAGVDQDGYGLTVNGAALAWMVAEDTLLLVSAPVASYWIGLTGVASHCKVGGGNPRGVRVESAVTTRAIFVVKCDPPPGSPTS
jgi:hypothetical protein